MSMADRGLRRSLQKRPPACSARGLKCFAVRVSTILPTTGPAKIKVEAKAEGLGFIQESGSGRSVEHFCTSVVCLCATPGKSGMSIGKFPQIWKSFKKARGGGAVRNGRSSLPYVDKKGLLALQEKGTEGRRSPPFRSSPCPLLPAPKPLSASGGASLLPGEDAVSAPS